MSDTLPDFDLTPVEFIGNIWIKREDKFSPLGYGGINGSKVRQCEYLFSRYIDSTKNPLGLVSGASVKSSQLAVGTLIAANYGLPSIHVIGATNPISAIRHEQVKIAHHFGAKFVITSVAYNPVLQRKVNDLVAGPLKGWFKLEYGSSLDHKTNSPEEIEKFHMVGALQVQNIPDSVRYLIVPTGSCNTLVSIIYGVRLFKPNIEKIICLQIGPDKVGFTEERLRCIESVTNLSLDIDREYHYLNKIWSYQDDVPYDFNGIEMHPTYEGKCFKYLESHTELLNEESCFWLTGSKPYLANMVSEPIPDYQSIRVWDG